MQLTKSLLLFVFPIFAFANPQIDPECVNHLGGAFSGVECYNGLASDMELKNKAMEKLILSKIPKGNPDRAIFNTYRNAARQAEFICRLHKHAYAKWQTNKYAKGPRYYDDDVVYFECIYNRKQEENRFLAQLIEYLDK